MSRFWVKQVKRERDIPGPPRAALLLRQSLTRNDSISLDDQEIHARNYCTTAGYQVVDVRRSENTRGWWDDREDHAHLRQLAEQGDVDVVVAYDTSRAARTVRIMEAFAYDLERHGVRLEFAAQQFANQPQGRQLLTVFAEMETSHRSMRLTHVWHTLRSRGRWHGEAPYGYRRADRTIVPDDVEAPIARRIYELAAQGVGSTAICRTLVEEGVTTRRGGRWSEAWLHRLLRNPAYAGGMRIHDETVWPNEGETWHEPLVDRATWDEVQRTHTDRPHVNAKPVASFLEGAIEHACGNRMYLVPTKGKNGDVLPMFRCRRRYQHPPCDVPTGEASARNVDSAARAALAQDFASVVSLDEALAEAQRAMKSDDTKRQRKAIEKRRSDLLQRRDNAEELRLSGRRTLAWFIEQDDEISQALRQLDTEEAALPAQPDRAGLARAADVFTSMADVITQVDDETLAQIVRRLGAVAVVEDAHVRWRYPGDVAWLISSPAVVRIPRARRTG